MWFVNAFFFLSLSLHPRPNSKPANALWIIRQIYWQRADYRNEWCMMPFCSIVHVSIYLLASGQKVWRHSIACPLASDRVLVIWYTGYSKRASLHRAERKSRYLHRYSKGQTERLNKLKIQRGQAKTRSYMRKWPETGKTARMKMMTDDRQKK